jgi:hypothetical protein
MVSARLGKSRAIYQSAPGWGRTRDRRYQVTGDQVAGEEEEERWAGRAEERSDDKQNPLVHLGPHPDVRERETDERADERAEVIEPDGTPSPRLPRRTESD